MIQQSTKPNESARTDEQIKIMASLAMKFSELGIEGKILPTVTVGPLVTAFRILPQGRTRVSNIEALAEDLAVLLGKESILVKRMPGESAVGIFIPNTERKLVSFHKTMSYLWQNKDKYKVPLCFGQTQTGEFFIEDLTELPHLLIGGSTGSGKSTLLHSLLSGLIYCKPPDELKLILSDTKGVEFGHFLGAPHLLFDPQTSVYTTLEKIKWAIDEMESRLKKIGDAGFRNIHEYNQSQSDASHFGQPHATKLPYIVIIIDELADLMGECQKLTETHIGKIVQKARAAGVYMIAATQRPSVDVIKGSIKSNFLARLAFKLPSGTDSRTILDYTGAEHLLSKGDMLYASPLRPGLIRLHAPKASIEDIKALIEASKYQR